MTNESEQSRNSKQSIHFEIGANCACLAVRKASRLITQLYDHHLATVDLKITQFTLLNAVAAGGSVPINALANALATDRTTLTRNLKPLQDHGFLALTASTEDRRVKLLSLTPSGKKLLARAIPVWKKAHAEFLSKVGEAHWLHLSEDLSSVGQAIMSK